MEYPYYVLQHHARYETEEVGISAILAGGVPLQGLPPACSDGRANPHLGSGAVQHHKKGGKEVSFICTCGCLLTVPPLRAQKAAERERQKANAAAAADRAAFQAQEARMAAELAQRTPQERPLLLAAAVRARLAAEQRRKCAASPP